ncbi:hypothetical protein [Sphingomonas sp.]|uniref:hypothetical protein n=1 Tax=Sphingomonas sp. TaxID=28214 RepID=UPI0017D55D4D|nr:hypothetical protein [Sphingomonas sp.]MBA3511366.1 hypothetical protein [Sphingomonas sp.]
MFELLILALAAAGPDDGIRLGLDPRPGVTPGENRTLSQPHPNATARMFPDMAIKGLRIDGDTLYVLVANQGRTRARGPIRVIATAESNGATAESAPARIGPLAAGHNRWVPLRDFAVKSATAGRSLVFALEDARVVSATVRLSPAISAAVDRTGRACLPSRGCLLELDETNNSLRAEGRTVPRGRP